MGEVRNSEFEARGIYSKDDKNRTAYNMSKKKMSWWENRAIQEPVSCRRKEMSKMWQIESFCKSLQWKKNQNQNRHSRDTGVKKQEQEAAKPNEASW